MSTATSSPHFEQEWVDDPGIPPDHFRYIQSLNESPACYTRFFDALLIQKPSHSQFFHDLKAFREQPAVIRLLQQGTKDAYRNCTGAFAASQFAHSWCHSVSDLKSGSTRGSWTGATKKVSPDAQREEDRLHRLLVPLWIAFRRRMFPEPEVLAEWVAGEEQRKKDRKAHPPVGMRTGGEDEDDAHNEAGSDIKAASRSSSESAPAGYPELGSKTTSLNAPSSSKPASNHSDSGAGAAASQLFLGVAVTGFLMSDKRIRKYVEKKLNKK
ncbi:hypothetical protein A1O3_03912 [Capronia epimyces CBS 606.96]|uniref:Uncharacterized protein n=1 Tax=Capronia epimyces CBS 606.96 TaxID=1182542 RepID=W9Y398_9EURO|nr:uncharacterized protein A1O3_03912 [Capronia epimyces CBS 606.96]EXJ86958.1 hypothetical protein A1O3_03912 [Capronia epimyces CBS 606.96]